MKITARHTFDATPDRVHAMMTNPEWLSRVAERVGASENEVNVDGDTTRLTAGVPAPDLVRRFVGDTLRTTLEQTWSAASATGERTGSLRASVAGMPASLEGNSTMTPDGERTVVSHEGEFSVSIPLVGRKIEQAAAPYVTNVLDLQQQVGTEWLAEGR